MSVPVHRHPRHANAPAGAHRAAVALATLVALGGLDACSESTRLPDRADVGPRPTLVSPVNTVLPTVHIAPASPWPEGKLPTAAPGTQVSAFASGLDHPRWLLVLPNGDVLVAETNAPPRQEESKGLMAWVKTKVMGQVMARAGAGVPSANRISLLRDADGDGRPETRSVFLDGLNSPFGMALVGDRFYVANTDAVMEYAYSPGQTRIEGPGRRLTELPAGPINHHWTKSLIASKDGSKLYATVGSNSNVAENGMQAEDGRAAIWEIDRATGSKRLFATGLRNPNGMAWMAGADGLDILWTVANERDEIGSDLVPDYLTSVRDGSFYGWPYSWYGQHVDARVQPDNPALVARAIAPDYALGAHVAALGLAATGSNALSVALAGNAPGNAAALQGAPAGVYIGLHGSWNRRPHSGYKVVYLPFAAGQPQGLPVDVLSGFLSPDGKAWGRPVGVAIDSRGALLVADDVGNTIWRVTPR
jgi:glucose/arabinose dehydrogenase